MTRRSRFVSPPARLLTTPEPSDEGNDHDDLADAATDGFTDGVWRRPIVSTDDEPNREIYQPGDEYIKAFSRPLSNEEVFDIMDSDQSDGYIYSPLAEFTAPISRLPSEER